MMTPRDFIFAPVCLLILIPFAKSIHLDENALIGIFSSAFTPFDEEGKLNTDAVEPYVKFTSENGVDGVIICDPVGEGSSLSLQERKQLLDAFLAARKKYGIQVVIQVGGMPIHKILDLTRYAAEAQVDAIITIPDVYYRPNDIKELIVYLKTIASAAPDTPFLYLDYPLITNVMLDMTQLLKQVGCQIPNFVGIKTSLDSGLEVIGNLQLKPCQRILGTTELSIASVHGYGLNASVSGISNVFPAEVKQIVDSVQAEDIAAAIEVQLYLNEIITASGFTPGYEHLKDFLAIIKVEMDIVNGIPLGQARLPLPNVGAEKRRALTEKLKELGVDVSSEE